MSMDPYLGPMELRFRDSLRSRVAERVPPDLESSADRTAALEELRARLLGEGLSDGSSQASGSDGVPPVIRRVLVVTELAAVSPGLARAFQTLDFRARARSEAGDLGLAGFCLGLARAALTSCLAPRPGRGRRRRSFSARPRRFQRESAACLIDLERASFLTLRAAMREDRGLGLPDERGEAAAKAGQAALRAVNLALASRPPGEASDGWVAELERGVSFLRARAGLRTGE